MTYFPLGDIDEERYEFCKKYKLVEFVNGIHRLTEKCRQNYDEISFMRYLQGKEQQPVNISKQRVVQDLLSM